MTTSDILEMTMNAYTPVIALLTALLLATVTLGCEDSGQPNEAAAKGSVGKSDSSVEAIFVDFAFEGQVLTETCFSPRRKIEDQVLFTIGQLNGENGVGRIDTLEVSDIETQEEGELCRVTYAAKMLVAWDKDHDGRESYTLKLPLDMSYAGMDRFVERYKTGVCLDPHAHDVDEGVIWYYWRPNRSWCDLSDDLVVEFEASVSPSPVHTSGKYPEYHKVWEDNALRVVAIFGKAKHGGDDLDVGVAGFRKFIGEIDMMTSGWTRTTLPAQLPTRPGIATPEVVFEAEHPDGRKVHVVAMLVDDVKTADAAFYARYESLTPDADLIIYNGHAGLGANIRTLARKGSWKQGQYVLVFMNGCDTYAYMDSALADAHADVNPDDPEGTKYVDIMMNAMPSFFRSMPAATMALVDGLMAIDAPQTYEQMFRRIDSYEVVIVSGEHDNVYVPGYDGEALSADWTWEGLSESGTLARAEEVRFQTTPLEPGRYVFSLEGTGDADLYIRVGEEPSADLFDCRPYAVGSKEACSVDLNTPAPVHILVRGWSESSNFALTGTRDR